MAGLDEAAHPVPPVDLGRPDELVHAADVDGHAAEGVAGLHEGDGAPDQPPEVLAPLLQGDDGRTGPVDGGGGHGGDLEEAGDLAHDVVRVDGVVPGRAAGGDGDRGAGQDHLEVEGGPALALPVGDAEAGDG